ncbi:MAG: 2-oxo acid dehydrogenase subunit E2 [Rhodothermales bacterium]
MPEYTVHPLNRLQTLVARNMHQALQETAHATLHTECDITTLVDTLGGMSEDEPVSVSTYVLYALTRALKEHPCLNAHIATDELCIYNKVKLGLMVHSGYGIMQACLSDAASLNLYELEAAVKDLHARARKGHLQLSETRGATFMVADLSAFPVDAFTPILLPSVMAMLGIGRVRPACRPGKRGCRPVKLLSLSLTFDHRGTDAIVAGHFLRSLTGRLEHPVED